MAQSGGCQGSTHFNDFDFWLGDWDVTDNSSGASDTTGKSINYFKPLRDEWRQVWVAPRNVINVHGGLVDGAMVLTGSIDYFNATTYDSRGSWTPSADGSVRPFFEQYDPDEKTWRVWFDGR